MKFSSRIEPISCDEAFLDVTGLGDPEALASLMRSEIETTTGCAASAGIGPNKLVARIATRFAKPNGQRQIALDDVAQILAEMDIHEIPGKKPFPNKQKCQFRRDRSIIGSKT